MKQAHISFDDVFMSLRFLTRNAPSSVFDMKFFGFLKRMHEEHDAVFSLYAFYTDGEFTLDMIPRKYGLEFQQAADWLKFGFHAAVHKHNALSLGVDDFNAALERFIGAVSGRISVKSACNSVRLHNWAATAEQVSVMQSHNIRTLFCRDNKGISYDLTPEESAIVSTNGCIAKNNMRYRRTDIRYDNNPDIDAALAPLIEAGAPGIVLFGHEKYFISNLDRIEKSIRLLFRNGYTFSAE